MAETSYPVNHALARKHWSSALMKETLKRTYALKFIGRSADSLCYVKEDTSKAKGDKITYGLKMQLQGAGVSGDGTMEGNEEAIVTYNDSLVINHLRNAVKSAGTMSEQRVPWNVRAENNDLLADWWADRIDTWFFNQLAGNTLQTDGRYTGFNSTTAPSSSIIFDAGNADSHTTEGSLASDDTFKLKLIDWAVEVAKTRTLPIRPIRYMGADYLVLFIHPFQTTSLRTDTGTLGWGDIQKQAMAGGKIADNPIFTGAMGIYNGVIIHETTRLPQTIDSGAYQANTRRAVLCGAQALCMAFGQGYTEGRMEWFEQLKDYGDKLGTSAGLIGGMNKSQFNSVDYGVITISTYAAGIL